MGIRVSHFSQPMIFWDAKESCMLEDSWYSRKWCHSSTQKLKPLVTQLCLFATPWTVAHQALLSMGFSRQGYWSGLPFPSPGDLLNPGIEPGSPALQADSLLSEPKFPASPDAPSLCKTFHIWFLHTPQTHPLLTSFDTNVGTCLSHPVYTTFNNNFIPLHNCSLSM